MEFHINIVVAPKPPPAQACVGLPTLANGKYELNGFITSICQKLKLFAPNCITKKKITDYMDQGLEAIKACFTHFGISVNLYWFGPS